MSEQDIFIEQEIMRILEAGDFDISSRDRRRYWCTEIRVAIQKGYKKESWHNVNGERLYRRRRD